MVYWQVDRKKVKTLLICYHRADLVFGLLWVTMQPLFCHDSGFAACPVLIKPKFSVFVLKQRIIHSHNLVRRVKTIWT